MRYCSDGDLTLQFVIDFSTALSNLSESSLVTALAVEKINEYAQALAPVNTQVSFSNLTFDIQDPEPNPSQITTTKALTVHVSGASVAASKWDNRDLSLIVRADGMALPPDATIRATTATQILTISPNATGEFIIPLGDHQNYADAVEVTLQLLSEMFPRITTKYNMTATLCVSKTNAGTAPLNTEVKNTPVSFAFQNSHQEFGVKIHQDPECRLYSNHADSTITVSVASTPASMNGYALDVQLHQEYANGFGNTAIPPSIDTGTNEYSFPLSGLTGNFCIVATIRQSDGLLVAKDEFYFIVRTEDQSASANN